MRKINFGLICSMVCCLGLSTGLAQDALNELTVDRPGYADSPYTVPKGSLQFELGFDYFNRYNGKLYDLPTGLLRAGLSQKVELRIESRNIVDGTDGNSNNVLSPLSVGAKVHMVHQKEWIPEIDILANVIIPITDGASQTNVVGHSFLLLFQNDFYPNMALNYNLGYVWDPYKGKPSFTASVCFNYLPTVRTGLFIEYFDFVPDRWPGELGIDGGVTYLLWPKFQIDLSGGVSQLNGEYNFFVSSGFSFRIH